MEVKATKSFFESLDDMTGIRHTYRSVRAWINYRFTKGWWNLFKTTMASYPYDHHYLLRLERAKLQEMIAYHEKARRFEEVEYVIRDMKIAVSLLNIIIEETDKPLFHFNGRLKFVPIEGTDDCEVKHSDDFKYVCDIKVNTKNVSRFVANPKSHKYYLDMPHELYIQKAKALYYKIRYEKTDYWWD